jgi:hypothetical protein
MIEKYIPHAFSSVDLVRWNTKFQCSNRIAMNKLLSVFSKAATKNCVGFVSETGSEILCCKIPDENYDDAWLSIRGSPHLVDKVEVNDFCNWLEKRGCLKRL